LKGEELALVMGGSSFSLDLLRGLSGASGVMAIYDAFPFKIGDLSIRVPRLL
jgi:hypothetical protein